MNVQVLDRPGNRAANTTRTAIADGDIHPSPKSWEKEVYPFLEARWQRHMQTYGMRYRQGFISGPPYPKGQPDAARRDAFPPNGGRAGSDLDFMSKEIQDQLAVEWGKFTPGDYQHTALEKIFVGGDAANRVADAISAIEDGHHAARGIDRFLNPNGYTNTDQKVN